MRLLMSLLVILMAIGIGFLLRHRKKELTFRTTDEFIQYMANEAVKDAARDGVSLDYSVDSIKRVEAVLGKLHDMYAANPASVSVRGLGSAYGAYVGEVMRRTEPGAHWERDDPVGGEKSYPLIWKAGHSYPMAWCAHRIENGPEDNVWVKYSLLKQRAEQKK